MTPYRVAIAGCHRQTHRKPGSHNWAVAFDAVDETEIVGAFDLGRVTRDEFTACWGDIPTFDDFNRMLSELSPDILCVATRQTMHADQIEAAVAAGVKGILSDKPLATSLAEADRIHSALKSGEIPFAFGLDRRWSPAYQAIRELIRDGAIGRPVGATAYAIPNLVNHGCHWFDALMMLLDDPEPEWVSGFAVDVSDEPEDSTRRLDPSGHGQIGFSNGTIAFVTPNPRAGRMPAFEIVGEEGVLLITDDARQVHQWKLNQNSKPEIEIVSVDQPDDDWPAGRACVRDLVGAIQGNIQTQCDREQARRTTEISFAFHESNALGGKRVNLPVADRERVIQSFPWGNE